MRTTVGQIAVSLLMVMLTVSGAVAQQTGTLSGLVRDTQGAVLPGVTVTVTGAALIGGPRVAVTGPAGSYQFAALPPGAYDVEYSLAGFTPLRREGISVRVAQITRLDVELGVGTLEETVTVSGESPVVDVSSTVTQTNITKELYEAIPVSRSPWTMAGLVPGVVTGRLDVGGTEGMQQYNLEAFGSANSQKSFSIDGLKTNWGGGNGGATMIYYGNEMYEEYNMQTASGTAESDVSGVYMNMVTKSGGNQFHSDHNMYFMNDALQGENIDAALRERLGLGTGEESAAAGNPIDISYDWSSTLGGPIMRDKVWFFGAVRWWVLDQFLVGALNPDGSRIVDDNRNRNFSGKATWQTTPSVKTSFLYNRNYIERWHRRNPPYLFVPDKATQLQDQKAENYVFSYNHVVGSRFLLEGRGGRMWGVNPAKYQKEVQPTDIAVRDVSRFTIENALTGQSLNPNHRYQVNGSASYFVDGGATGSHDVKAGVQLSWERMAYIQITNGDRFGDLDDGVAFRANLSNTPINSDHRLQSWGAFFQDRWIIGRATINAGVRIDGVSAYLPAQTSPAGTFVGERSFPRTDVFEFGPNVVPRIGIAYDIFGTGRTALKAYYGRFYNQFGSELAQQANPNARVTQSVSWTDTNGDRIPQVDELGEFLGFPSGLFPKVASDATRPYSDEFNAGITQSLASNLAVSVSYHRRQHRNGLGVLDLARTADAYTPEDRTFTNADGSVDSITIYRLKPAFAAARDRIITNVEFLESNYDGMQVELQKRMSDRWQLLTGVSIQKHRGFDHSGTFTNSDFSNPNASINRNDGEVFQGLPWTFTLTGSYILPADFVIAGKYTARAGDPLNRTVTFRGLTTSQVSETVNVQQRGEDRTDTVNKFVDLRLSKRFRLARGNLEAAVDLFNVLNANHVLGQSEALGGSWARPNRILAPRIVRLGLTARF